jgi:hypothetical protein
MDAEFSFNVLRLNGYMLFDDYGYSIGTKNGIDEFIREFKKWDRIKVLNVGYQVLVQKTA